MGYLIRISSPQEKATICRYLRDLGYSQKISPFLPHGQSFNTECIFSGKYFYGCHWRDVDAIMEGEEMLEVKEFSQLKEIIGL